MDNGGNLGYTDAICDKLQDYTNMLSSNIGVAAVEENI